jgi:peptide/nickel transport system permease protein
MMTFLLRRLIFMVITVAAISMVGFTIINLPPGSALEVRINQLRQQGGDISIEYIRGLEERYGLRDPLHVKYLKWVSRAIRGDFGQSFVMQDQPVGPLIWQRLGFSVGLALFAIIFSWSVAIPLGVYAATHRYSWPDYVISFFQFVGFAIPEFLAALLLLVFASQVLDIEVGVLFSRQYRDAPWSFAKFVDFLKHIWIPCAVLAISGTAWLTRVMRANLLDVLGQQYVQTARSKGLQEYIVIWKHAVRNALHPLIMALGGAFPALVSGEVIVSIVTNMPTTGPIYARALITKDMYLAVTILLMLSIAVVIGNLIADLLLAWADPRIRLE